MRNELVKKFLAIALALVVGVTFIPLLGDSVYAEGESDVISTVPEEEPITDDVQSEDVTDAADITEGDNETPVSEATEEVVAPDSEPVADESANMVAAGDSEVAEDEGSAEQSTALESENDGTFHLNAITLGDLYAVSATRNGNTLTINASFKDHPAYAAAGKDKNLMRFRKIYIDGYQIGDDLSNMNKLENYQIDISNYLTPGFHSVFLAVFERAANSNVVTYVENTYAVYYRAGIMSAPSAKGSFAIYHNYLDYMSPVDYNLINYKLFVEYSRNGKTWKTYGPMDYIQTYKMKGLRANTKYYVRSYYGVYLNGEWFTSKEEGLTKWLGSFRTGVARRPAVKSVQVKAYKVKKKTQRVYGYYTGLYLGKRKYYKYKLKIIVTLKKKPGNKIWINGKKFKGNKKKYTVNLGTFTSYSKPKGKKYKVAMYTYRSAAWGGYSPMYKKSIRIK